MLMKKEVEGSKFMPRFLIALEGLRRTPAILALNIETRCNLRRAD